MNKCKYWTFNLTNIWFNNWIAQLRWKFVTYIKDESSSDLITDYKMPQKTSLEFIKKIRENNTTIKLKSCWLGFLRKVISQTVWELIK